MKAVFVVVHLGSIKGAMAADAVDVPLLVSGLIRQRFRRLKKDQLTHWQKKRKLSWSQPRSGGSFPPSGRHPTLMSELHCHWCHKLGH